MKSDKKKMTQVGLFIGQPLWKLQNLPTTLGNVPGITRTFLKAPNKFPKQAKQIFKIFGLYRLNTTSRYLI